MKKFNEIADEILMEDIQLDEAVLKNMKKFVKSVSGKLEAKLIKALKNAGQEKELTDDEALEVMKNIFKEIEKEELY